MSLYVQKYGGSSVATMEQLAGIASGIKARTERGDSLIVVVSAMGNTTDQLLQQAKELSKNPPSRELDMLVTTGERVTMALLSIRLQSLGVESVSFTGSQSGILTDSIHGNAKIVDILGGRISGALNKSNVVIIAGFQGYCAETGEITTLGRGGTDLTAVALGAKFKAKAVEFYKDVPGILNASPKVVKDPSTIQELSLDSLERMTHRGANVLHDRCLHVARKYAIDLEICHNQNPSQVCTKVSHEISKAKLANPSSQVDSQEILKTEEPVFESLGAVPSLVNVSLFSPNLDSKIIQKAIETIWGYGFQYYFCNYKNNKGNKTLELLLSQAAFDMFLKSEFYAKHSFECVEQESDLSLVSLIGSGFKQNPQVLGRVMAIVEPICLEVRSEQDSIDIVIYNKDFEQITQLLHAEFLA